MINRAGIWFIIIVLGITVMPRFAAAHCDTLDGPVVSEARQALEKDDITPVLTWVRKEDEKEVREVFRQAMIVRVKGSEAKDLADMYFFETLVRIHRAAEGAPYTGLKPAGEIDPAVVAADRALDAGSDDALVKMISDAAAKGIRERFAHASEARKRASHSVMEGREFVKRYVEFTHYVERLHMDAVAGASHHEAPKKGRTEEHHH